MAIPVSKPFSLTLGGNSTCLINKRPYAKCKFAKPKKGFLESWQDQRLVLFVSWQHLLCVTVHSTSTWICQHDVVDFTLSCEGVLKTKAN